MSKRFLGLFLMAMFLLSGAYSIYGQYCSRPVEGVSEPDYEPDCGTCTDWYLNPAYEYAGHADPYFIDRDYLIIPYVAPVELFTAKGLNPAGFDCEVLVRNIYDLLRIVDEWGFFLDPHNVIKVASGGLFKLLSPDPAYAWAYTCSAEIVDGRTVNIRVPLQECCAVLVDESPPGYWTIELRKLSDLSLIPGITIVPLGTGGVFDC